MAKKGESPAASGAADKEALNGKRSSFKSSSKKTILLIEDDSTLASMYKMKLESEGFIVQVSSDGKYGLKAMRDYHPDLVLLDVLMPGKDGFDVLSEKSKCPVSEIRSTPIIVLTNLASPDDQAEGRRLGATDWWIKAYNTPAEVAAKVKKFLETNSSQVLQTKAKIAERVI